MQGDSFEKIIPRAKPKTGILTNAIFYLCLAILGFLAIAFFFLNNEIAVFENEKKIIESNVLSLGLQKQEKAKEVIALGRNVKLFKGLFEEHRLVSRFFPFFESIIHPKVYVSKLTLGVNDSQASFEGETENFKSMGEQILVLKQKQGIESIALSNLSFSDAGRVSFALSFSFAKDIIKGFTQESEQ